MQNNIRFLASRKKDVIILVSIILLYFITRFFFLTTQPVFGDEALYVWFAREVLVAPHNWYISLVVGRQPLFIWITALFLLLFKDSLFAIRLISVLSGFTTMIGLAMLSYEIFHSKKIVFFTMVLMLFYPFAFVYDRLGILDSMVGAVYIWALYLTFLLVKKPTLFRVVCLGILLGIGLLIKSTDLFALLLLPLSFFLLPKVKKYRKQQVIVWSACIALVIIIAQGITFLSRLAPNYAVAGIVNRLFIYSFYQVLLFSPRFIADHLMQNVSFIGGDMFSYMTIPYILLLIISMVITDIKNREKLIVFFYFLIPAVAIVFLGRNLETRNFYFLLLPLFIFIGEAWDLGNRFVYSHVRHYASSVVVTVCISICILWYPAYVCWQIATNLSHAPILAEERDQYIRNVGWGKAAAVNFFCLQVANGKKIVVGTYQGEDVTLQTYLGTNPYITFVSYFPGGESVQQLIDFSKKNPTYLVTYNKQDVTLEESKKLSLVFTASPGISETAFSIYRVSSQK